jgi:hypothetical protein
MQKAFSFELLALEAGRSKWYLQHTRALSRGGAPRSSPAVNPCHGATHLRSAVNPCRSSELSRRHIATSGESLSHGGVLRGRGGGEWRGMCPFSWCVCAGAAVPGLVSGPPCQPFSTAGAAAGFADDRACVFSTVVKWIIELARRGVLKFFILENVLGLGRHAHACAA